MRNLMLSIAQVLSELAFAFIRPITYAMEKVLTVDKWWGLRRLRVRDILIFSAIGWVLLRHWSVVAHTGITDVWQTEGLLVAKVLAIFIFVLPRYFLKVLFLFFLPDSLRVLLPVFVPYFLAKYAAVRYVEDVYEISDALRDREEGYKVAQEFLLRAAFANGYGRVREKKTWGCRLLGPLRPLVCPTEAECLKWGRSRRYGVRVRFWQGLWDFIRGKPLGCPHALAIVDGEVVDRRSPLLLVGGPGYVFISADSAAVFEQPDGTLRVVGPTGQRLYLMRGFERLRRIISLREHQLSVSIKTRSRDGIPIEIKDVQLLFSIYRGRRPPTHQTPYPFAPEALRQLVFNEMASPLTDRWEALASSRLLTNAMRNVARSTLNAFIHSQTVVEFMASVCSADWETLEEVYRQVANELQSVSHRNGLTFQPPPHPAPPAFVPRPQITERFQNFLNSERGRNALAKGVGIEWVGIGAWHTPVSKVIDQHLDAWRLSISNVLRSSPGTLKQLEYQRRLSAFAEYTRELLARFYQTTDQDSLQRQATLLKYFLDRLEAAALLRYGGLNHAPAAWRQAADRLRAMLPHNVLS